MGEKTCSSKEEKRERKGVVVNNMIYIFISVLVSIALIVCSTKVFYDSIEIRGEHQATIQILENTENALEEAVVYIAYLERNLFGNQLVTITFYFPKAGGINTDGDPYNTATMTRPTVGRTIAISDELYELGWLGSRVYIEGFGVFVAEDRMGASISGKQIDILVGSEAEAFRLGVLREVRAIRLVRF